MAALERDVARQHSSRIQTRGTSTPSRISRPIAPVASLRQLQRTAGNVAIARLLRAAHGQPKLAVGPVDDEYEREADRVADEIARMPDPSVEPIAQRVSPQLQRLCPECEEEEETEAQRTPIQIRRMCPACEEEEAQRMPDPVQRMCPACEEEAQREPEVTIERAPKQISRMCPECEEEAHRQPDESALQRADRDPPDASAELATYVESSRHGGQPLPQAARGSFEARFGQDFGGVRVHTGTRAAEAAAEINALAFTTGSDIYFGADRFSPGTATGDRLLAHELTHTIQQTGGRGLSPASSAPENTDGSSESTTDASPGGDVQRTPSQTIQRMSAPEDAVPHSVPQILQTAGRPLDETTRSLMA